MVKHYHHHYRFSYTTSLRRHLSSVIIVVTVFIVGIIFLLHYLNPQSSINLQQVSFSEIMVATINTITRLLFAYALAMLLSVPLALLITNNERFEKVLLPMFDIIQSVPALAFFPVIVVTFVKANFLEGAAIFIIMIAMMGSLVFSMIGGLKSIPSDITAAAHVFGAKGFRKLRFITIPAIFPTIITGSLLSWSQAWSIIIVAEALHTYIPNGTPKNDLYGLGSLLVDSFAQGKTAIFLVSLSTMIIIITLLNYFVWQKLLHATERFRFD